MIRDLPRVAHADRLLDMSLQDVAIILAMLGGITLILSWVAHRTGDAARDVRLMLAIGAGMVTKSGVLFAID